MNIELFEHIASIGSTNEKAKDIAKFDAVDRKMTCFALDPSITFGITLDEIDVCAERERRPLDAVDISPWWLEFLSLLVKLSKRELTGNAASAATWKLIRMAPSVADAKWASRVINKDLRCGFGITIFNNVFPGSIDLFAVALARPFDPDKHETRGSFYVEPKLDGLRCVVIDGVPFTRNGHKIGTIKHIIDQIGSKFLENHVLDGELMGPADFDENSGMIRRKEGTNVEIVYNVFDVIDTSEWKKRSTRGLSLRKLDLDMLPESKNVKRVPYGLVVDPTIQELFAARDVWIARGFEGAMFKDANSPYVFERSNSLLKLKRFETADGKITDVKEGRGKLKGMLGAVFVEVDGVISKCGSGFNEDQRERLWAVKENLIGKMIEVQFQNKSSAGALRFPVFIRFRPDKE
jgi:DNA ligase-1